MNDAPKSQDVHQAAASGDSTESAGPASAEQEARAMFVSRLENMQKNGDRWLTVAAVLALLNDCDMCAALGESHEG